MKIQILNKNRINPNGNWELSNIQAYDVDEGGIINETYNETLDSGTLFVSNLASEIEIEPYDLVLITDEDGRFNNKYMCVDNYTKTQTSIVPEIFSYEINLFSETKLLENYICPNLSITVNDTNKSIFYYLNIYNGMFGKKVYTEQRREIGAMAWTFSQRCIDKFSAITCPEKQWNNPTLREVFNDLMIIADCIPVLHQGVIDYIDLTETNTMSTAKKSHINYIRESRSSEDYVSDIQMTMQNVLGADTVLTSQNLVLLPENGATLTDTNGVLKLNNSIINIKKLKVGIFSPLSPATSESGLIVKYQSLDITSLVKEEKEWELLPITSKLGDGQNLETLSSYQNTSLHYKRGSNEIIGFGSQLRINIAGTTRTLLYRLAEIMVGDTAFFGSHDDWEKYLYFTVEYETTISDTFSASKSDYPTHKKTVIDNQTNAWVNSNTQGLLEYFKANRLGNKQLLINAIYENDYTNLIKIGDTYEDNIVYQCEYSIYKHYIQVNAYATKDYVLQNYFTGVKSKIRTWKNAEDEAFDRNDLFKLYYQLSFTNPNRTGGIEPGLSNSFAISSGIRSSCKIFEKNKIKYCYAQIGLANGERIPSPGKLYNIDLLSRIKGNSIVFTANLNGNWYIGANWKNDSFTTSANGILDYNIILASEYANFGGLPIDYKKLCDENGNFNTIGFYFSNKPYNGYFNENEEISGENFLDNSTAGSQEVLRKILNKPIVGYNTTGSYPIIINCNYYKDLREIPKISFEIEVCSNTRDITFTKEFINALSIINDSDKYSVDSLTGIVSGVKVWIGNLEDYNYDNPTLYNATYLQNGVVRYRANKIEIQTGHSNVTHIITDAYNNILLMCKPKQNETTSIIYTDFFTLRDKNYYNENNRLIKAGEVL